MQSATPVTRFKQALVVVAHREGSDETRRGTRSAGLWKSVFRADCNAIDPAVLGIDAQGSATSNVHFGQRYSSSQGRDRLSFVRSDSRSTGGEDTAEVGSRLEAPRGCDCALASRTALLALAKRGFSPAYQHRSPWGP
jgi:hypothetical protein